MRIVMVTPDNVYIDRRILQEAEVLFEQGHEIILLADWREGLPRHEWLGNVKVERLDPRDLPPAMYQKIIPYVQSKLVGLLKRLAGPMRYRVMTFLIRVVNKAAELALRTARKFDTLPVHEQHMLNQIIYYDPDVVHVHDLPYLRVGVHAKKRLRVPLVYDAHELYTEINTLSANDKARLSQIEAESIKLCDQVITVNPFIAEEMGKRYQVPTPNVILNAVSPPVDLAAKRDDRFREEFSIPTDHHILLFQGWLSLERGLDDLAKAMVHLPETSHLVFMGYGDDAIQTLTKIAQDEGIADRIHFKAAVPQDELLYWTTAADAGIIPYQPVDLNHYYCSPNKLFEFMQAELPIIANDLPYLRQIVAEEDFGVVMSLETIDDYAKAIREMFDANLGGPNRFRTNLGRNKNKFDWQVEARKLLGIYNKLGLN